MSSFHKYILSSACGGLIGTWIVLSVGLPEIVGLLLGIVIGFVFGYLFCDISNVLLILGRVRKTEIRILMKRVFSRGNIVNSVKVLVCLTGILLQLHYLILLVWAFFETASAIVGVSPGTDSGFIIFYSILMSFLGTIMCVTYIAFLNSNTCSSVSDSDDNIKTIYFWPYYLVMAIPSIVMWFVGIGKKIFIGIHSDERICCGVDVAIGVCLGSYFGNLTIGYFAGLIVGIIHYKITEKIRSCLATT